MNFSETGGKNDNTYFGEAPDANDGPPVDSHDTMKVPPPPPTYLRAWFNDSLPTRYKNLWGDYREYPDTSKVWNLSVQWYPDDYVSPTTVTIIWSTTNVSLSEYDKVILCDKNGVVLVPDMSTNR